jgi:hypothetical protein
VNNLKKFAKDNFYVSINESLSERRSRIRISILISDVIHILSLGLIVTQLVGIHSCAICMNFLVNRLQDYTMSVWIKGEGPSSKYPPLHSPNQNDASAFDNSDKCNLLNDYFCSITDLQDDDIPLPDFDDRLYNYEFGLSLCKIVRSSVILLLPLFTSLSILLLMRSGPTALLRSSNEII